jgi:signal transduction histidine kinase
MGRHEMQFLTMQGRWIGLALENLRLGAAADQNQRLADAGQTAVSLSHGIKNVIQAIGGSIEVIDYSFKTNKFERALTSWEILKRNLNRVRQFTLDMLAFSVNTKVRLTAANLNTIIENAADSLRRGGNLTGVRMDLQLDKTVPTGQMDADKMHDLVLNLIINAIDAVEENKGIIMVETQYLAAQGAVRLCVRDNGCGIKAEDKEKIWLPFHTTKIKTGTGLGLAMVKRIIEQHGGSVTVESQVGAGSEFSVLLPLSA